MSKKVPEKPIRATPEAQVAPEPKPQEETMQRPEAPAETSQQKKAQRPPQQQGRYPSTPARGGLLTPTLISRFCVGFCVVVCVDCLPPRVNYPHSDTEGDTTGNSCTNKNKGGGGCSHQRYDEGKMCLRLSVTACMVRFICLVKK